MDTQEQAKTLGHSVAFGGLGVNQILGLELFSQIPETAAMAVGLGAFGYASYNIARFASCMTGDGGE